MSVGSALAAFFDGVVPVLQGTTDPSAFGGRVEEEGLAFYQRMTGLELRRYLEQACPGVAVAVELAGQGSFAELARAYFRVHPPTGWDPGAVGAHLSAFLNSATDPRWTAPYLSEIADIHTLLRTVALAEDRAQPAFEHTLFVRRYETDSPRFVRCVLEGAAGALPVESPTVTLIFRSYRTRRAHLIVPSAPLLRALLAEARGEPTDPGVRSELIGLGVIPNGVGA